MSCLSSTRITELQAQLVRLDAQYTALSTAITNGTTHVENYTLDTGEARQMVKYRNFKEMYDVQDRLWSEIERINRILRGTGLMNLNVRRGR